MENPRRERRDCPVHDRTMDRLPIHLLITPTQTRRARARHGNIESSILLYSAFRIRVFSALLRPRTGLTPNYLDANVMENSRCFVSLFNVEPPGFNVLGTRPFHTRWYPCDLYIQSNIGIETDSNGNPVYSSGLTHTTTLLTESVLVSFLGGAAGHPSIGLIGLKTASTDRWSSVGVSWRSVD